MVERSVVTKLVAGRGQPDRGEQRALLLTVGSETRRFAAPSITLGSSPRCDLVISDPTVSRHHARIEVQGEELVLHDLGSTNGTTLDGVRVSTAFLGERARIELGNTLVELRVTDEVEPFAVHPTSAFGRLRGTSLAMRRLFAILERVAGVDTTALVLGESGTGKELIGEALHQRSRRANGPFVVVDCGALPAALIESELFGHEKGAFTGAVAARTGAFELADGGTLFLDEIGELDLALQPRLLRALEARQIKRLGADRYHAVDVRVVAATNRDLAAMVTAGDFREDLYHRLAVIELRVPPLRERPDDIALLARLFAEEILDREPAAQREALTPTVIANLTARKWPGNVRELRNHVERAVLLAGLTDDAPLAAPVAESTADEVMTWPYAIARQHVLDRFERDYVTSALSRSGDNVAQAAREAKLERSYLFKLIRRHKLR
jgi:transcriptional regulator with GAF, ATPase, and Fis domain